MIFSQLLGVLSADNGQQVAVDLVNPVESHHVQVGDGDLVPITRGDSHVVHSCSAGWHQVSGSEGNHAVEHLSVGFRGTLLDGFEVEKTFLRR